MNEVDRVALNKAVNKWEETAPIEIILDIAVLKEHFLTQHGIKFKTFGEQPIVVDQQLYTMFLLRFS